ncbi:Ubiquitin carboxyl-terminal hydrolase [Penicillium ucsense]|uniref:Ubiquitin carboxyl-terminal hydrolase n=1 Tax=Penicillium ucsense TaxID=2839758 RepID=A0A8J8WCB7_9EURO|nr:Ubiquitin carboxyl-terminal hydrolase [Penicillium ucsense]KAF7739312.1 Ubiquitin carboxyl-terminal hydrolase [Penicillium ucsense]
MPHGQPPMGPPRRQQDYYNPAPPNMRAPAYMGYPPHMNGHLPPAYSPQQFPPWYPPYGHMQQMPPRPYQPPYGPMIVSSYPQAQPIMAPSHMPHHSLPMQPRAATPMQSTMSPSLSAPPPLQAEMHEPHSMMPIHSQQMYPLVSSPPHWEPKPVVSQPEPVFTPPVPWVSTTDVDFPTASFSRRNVRPMPEEVQFPPKDGRWIIGPFKGKYVKPKQAQATAIVPSEPQTPTTSVPFSDGPSTQATTPSSADPSSTPSQQVKRKEAKPAVPIVPVVPTTPVAPRRDPKDSSKPSPEVSDATGSIPSTSATENTTVPISPVQSAPKSWADLVRNKNAARSAGSAAPEANQLAIQKNESLADVLSSLSEDVSQYSDKIAFLEPRGLVNTGNMCYMNSVLQILVSCVPFHQFLDLVGRRAAHSFHSDMPLIDAMIMFMREFNVIDAASSEEQLRLRLKPNELEQYGEAFVPEFVYEMIRQLPRFRDMRRGHQQDAQEFLGFLLEELHEECDRASKHISKSQNALGVDGRESFREAAGDGEWLEVGHKQKAAVTQLSGAIAAESPITRIFGGKLRSEFKVPGNKTSVTMEPYQPLQLDIGAPDVHNIIDALKGLTKPESIQGDFNSSRGPNVTATKQMFIETLPPVLILHLKRFQYDSVTGATQKIWKKVGYPLDLEIPREVFPAHRRNALAAQGGLPKYRLMGVIYHHGKNASGGHYTVDVRRQDGREWIRMDDTVIRRVRSEDVAEAGGEEDPKVLAAALEQHRNDKVPRSNIFENIDQDDIESAESDKGWSQVNGSSGHSSKKSINGIAPASNPSSGVRTPLGRYGSRDNRVAYLLFYQRVA